MKRAESVLGLLLFGKCTGLFAIGVLMNPAASAACAGDCCGHAFGNIPGEATKSGKITARILHLYPQTSPRSPTRSQAAAHRASAPSPSITSDGCATSPSAT